MKKKKYIITAVATGIVLMIAGAVLLAMIRQGRDENRITRYEWLEMLENQYEIEAYGHVPYFKDVSPDNRYFAYVQSAVEWEIIDAAPSFHGDQYVTGEFVALTAMKAIGERKLQIYLDMEETITDDAYIELAVEKGIIDRGQLEKRLSAEECTHVLENIRTLYFGEFWRDDYAEVTYHSGVVEMDREDVLQYNTSCTEILAADHICNSLEVGKIVVFEQKNTGLMTAREVTGISPDGMVSLKPVELDQVVESFVVSDIAEVALEDIARYNGWESGDSAAGNVTYGHTNAGMIDTAVFSGNLDSKGFQVTVSVDSGEEDDTKYLEIEFTDNDTGISYQLPMDMEVDSEDEFSVEIGIDRILVGAQASYSFQEKLEYADVAADINAVFKGELKMEQEVEIPLFKVPVPLAWGLAEIEIQFNLIMSLDGSISFEAELPVEMSVHYEKDKGLMNLSREAAFANPRIEVNCNAGAMLGVSPMLQILGIDVIGVELEAGAAASAEVTMYDTGQVCTDVSTAYPVMKLSVELNEEISELLEKGGIPSEWDIEIITADNAPYQRGLHFEKLPDGTVQFVEKCTFGEWKGGISASAQQEEPVVDEVTEFAKYAEYELPVEFRTVGPFEDHGGYYTVKGYLRIYYTIFESERVRLHSGDRFEILDKQFIMGDSFDYAPGGEYMGVIEPLYCENDNCNYCFFIGMSLTDEGSRYGDFYSTLYHSVPGGYGIGEPACIDLGECELRVARDALITSVSKMNDFSYSMGEIQDPDPEVTRDWDEERWHEETRAVYERYFYAPENRMPTAEDCYEDNSIVDGVNIAACSDEFGEKLDSVWCYIVFDQNGMIDTIIIKDDVG